MAKSIEDYKQITKKFCDERDWVNDNPSHLINSIFIELGELAEHFQWKSKFDVEYSEDDKKAIAFEIVDVFVYLMRLTEKMDIDLEASFDEKLVKLAEKFKPGTNHRVAHQKYRETGKNKLYK